MNNKRLLKAMDLRNVKAIDICRDLNIPKSTMSQYISGHVDKISADRFYSICQYLDVSPMWLMGDDVPMDKNELKKQEEIFASIINKCKTDNTYLQVVEHLVNSTPEQIAGISLLLGLTIE